MVQALPPLEPGETEIVSGAATQTPAKGSLLNVKSAVQEQAATMHVDIATMGSNHSLQNRRIELPLLEEDADMTDSQTWIMALQVHGGKTSQSEAACKRGEFQCSGDAAWCAEQHAHITCSSVPLEASPSLRQRAGKLRQQHLKA